MNFANLIERLSHPGPPWLYKADLADVPQIQQADQRFPLEATIVSLDAATMTTLDDFFEVAASKLLFPDYFGHNWPAFDECLADIYEWHSTRIMVLFFVNSGSLLSRDPADLPTLFRVLEKAAQELAGEIREGQPWDRPSVAFHVVFDFGIEATAMGNSLPLLKV
jgi:RNAse (barnase) inhibitor barstar